MKILFVCDGNIFRSTMAEALFNRIIEDGGCNDEDVKVSSAGIIAIDGNPASPYAVFAMRKRGISLEGFRARRLSSELVWSTDLILTMEEKQRHYILELVPEAVGKTYTLGAFCGKGNEIHDLGEGGFDAVERIVQEIEDCIKMSLPKIMEMMRKANGC